MPVTETTPDRTTASCVHGPECPAGAQCVGRASVVARDGLRSGLRIVDRIVWDAHADERPVVPWSYDLVIVEPDDERDGRTAYRLGVEMIPDAVVERIYRTAYRSVVRAFPGVDAHEVASRTFRKIARRVGRNGTDWARAWVQDGKHVYNMIRGDARRIAGKLPSGRGSMERIDAVLEREEASPNYASWYMETVDAETGSTAWTPPIAPARVPGIPGHVAPGRPERDVLPIPSVVDAVFALVGTNGITDTDARIVALVFDTVHTTGERDKDGNVRDTAEHVPTHVVAWDAVVPAFRAITGDERPSRAIQDALRDRLRIVARRVRGAISHAWDTDPTPNDGASWTVHNAGVPENDGRAVVSGPRDGVSAVLPSGTEVLRAMAETLDRLARTTGDTHAEHERGRTARRDRIDAVQRVADRTDYLDAVRTA